MIFSLAIVPEIYRDKSDRWRVIHAILNYFPLSFIGQGFTVTRDLLESPLIWQESYVYKFDFVNKSSNMEKFYKIISSATEEQGQNLADLTNSGFGSFPAILGSHI